MFLSTDSKAVTSSNPVRTAWRATSQPPGVTPMTPPVVEKLKTNRFYRERSRERGLLRQGSHERGSLVRQGSHERGGLLHRQGSAGGERSSVGRETSSRSEYTSSTAGPGYSSLMRHSQSVKSSFTRSKVSK